MSLRKRGTLILLAALALPASSWAEDAAGAIRDHAAMLQPATREEALTRIANIRKQLKKYHHDRQIVVWTAKEFPKERLGDATLKDARVRRKKFEEWGKDLMSQEKIEGVLLLICQEPPEIEIVVDKTTDPMFPSQNREHVRSRRLLPRIYPTHDDVNRLQTGFQVVASLVRQDQVDDAVLDGLDYIGIRLNWNRPVDQSRWYSGLSIIGVMLGVWAVLVVMRARLKTRTSAEAGVHDVEQSGRSIAVLGGGMGAVTGQWLARRLLGVGTVNEPTPPPEPAPRVAVQDLEDAEQGPDMLSLPEPPTPEKEP